MVEDPNKLISTPSHHLYVLVEKFKMNVIENSDVSSIFTSHHKIDNMISKILCFITHKTHCVDHIISHVINLIIGLIPIKVKCKDLSLDVMKFILNNADYQYVGP